MTEAKLKKVLAALIILVIIVGACLAAPLFLHPDSADLKEDVIEEVLPPDTIELSVLCVGDIMAHSPQLSAAYDDRTGEYDFNDYYDYVKGYIKEADVALCNVETTFGGEPYSGYPAFSSPDSFASALNRAGFDVAMTANNHMYDRGGKGVTRTLEVLRERFLLTTGSRLSEDEARYTLYDVGDIDVAVIAYTYETPSDGVALNGVPVKSEVAPLINSFSYDELDENYIEIEAVVDEAKSAGADLVILYLHFGEEYQTSANSWQRQMAEYIASNMDVDAIFASHPHNLQEMELLSVEREDIQSRALEDEEGNITYIEEPITIERSVPVFYSLGNFVSNQSEARLGPGFFKTEIGCIAKVDFVLDYSSHEVKDINMSAIPTWVDRYTSGGKDKFTIIPLDENLENNPTIIARGTLARALQAKELAYELLNMQ